MLLCVTVGGCAGEAVMDKAETLARSELYPELANSDIKFSEIKGLETTTKVVYQDPSHIMKIDGKYHVWYTRYPNDGHGDRRHDIPNRSKIWLAVSEDGWNWTERVDVLEDSQPGSWHEYCKHAPYVIRDDGKYYMFYTARYGPSGWNKRIGLAIADNPAGPFKHYGDKPLLVANAESKVFDTIGQDDACVLKRDGKYWLYFKAYGVDPKADEKIHPKKEIYNVTCLAFADSPCGPYKRWKNNPLTMSHVDYVWSHTTCMWPHRKGVAIISDNWQQSVKYSDDGINFHETTKLKYTTDSERLRASIVDRRHGHAISDPGVYCPEPTSEGYGSGVRWGLSQLYESFGQGPEANFSFFVRFDWNLAVSNSNNERKK